MIFPRFSRHFLIIKAYADLVFLGFSLPMAFPSRGGAEDDTCGVRASRASRDTGQGPSDFLPSKIFLGKFDHDLSQRPKPIVDDGLDIGKSSPKWSNYSGW